MHVVAVVGGAVAGSEAAKLLAKRGALVVVFEQGARPYGKIEDGLPKWHEKLRNKEYAKINENLEHERIMFVPNTSVGKDVTIPQLKEWGFSAVVLANGAWRDRTLPVDVDEYIGKGFLYQNALVHWFNHQHEADYSGPDLSPPEGAVVVGGGLASVDVVKICQFVNYQKAFAKHGVEVGMHELETKGIPATLAKHGLEDRVDVKDSTLFYRRDMQSMPLASPKDDSPEALKKAQAARVKLMERVINKYRVKFEPLTRPHSALTAQGKVVGLRFIRTQLVDGRVKDVEGSEFQVTAPIVISSIGSVPAPIADIPMRGELYDFVNWDTGELRDLRGVFGLGNVLTGKGNIRHSRANSIEVSGRVAEEYLGLADGDAASDALHQKVSAAVEPMVDVALSGAAATDTQIETVREEVQKRWKRIGFTSLTHWLSTHAPSH